MVTEKIKDANRAISSCISTGEEIASAATSGEQTSQEEIEMRKLEQITKKAVSKGIDATISIEKSLRSNDKNWGQDTANWGTKQITHTEEKTW